MLYHILGEHASHNTTDAAHHTLRIIPKSNIKIVEREIIDATNTQIHDRRLSWLGTGTSIKSGGVKLDSYIKIISILSFTFHKH